MGSLLQQYISGDHLGVWDTLLARGEEIRSYPSLGHALAVARETMVRARENIQSIKSYLDASGYVFRFPDQVFVTPAPDVDQMITALEGFVGPIPLSLQAWYETIGQVNFVGYHPRWKPAETLRPFDPLYVEPLQYVLEEYKEWRRQREAFGHSQTSPFAIPISPDYYFKTGYGGGPPYAIAVPNGAADARIEREWHETTFVGYLRIVFRWAGFPGMERCGGFTEPGLEELAKRLLPL